MSEVLNIFDPFSEVAELCSLQASLLRTVDQIATARHRDMCCSSQSFAVVFQLFESCLDNISSSRCAIAEAQSSLSDEDQLVCRGKEAWWQVITLRYLGNLVAFIERLTYVPTKLRALLSECQYFLAVALAFDSSSVLKAIESGTAGHAFKDLQRDCLSCIDLIGTLAGGELVHHVFSILVGTGTCAILHEHPVHCPQLELIGNAFVSRNGFLQQKSTELYKAQYDVWKEMCGYPKIRSLAGETRSLITLLMLSGKLGSSCYGLLNAMGSEMDEVLFRQLLFCEGSMELGFRCNKEYEQFSENCLGLPERTAESTDMVLGNIFHLFHSAVSALHLLDNQLSMYRISFTCQEKIEHLTDRAVRAAEFSIKYILRGLLVQSNCVWTFRESGNSRTVEEGQRQLANVYQAEAGKTTSVVKGEISYFYFQVPAGGKSLDDTWPSTSRVARWPHRFEPLSRAGHLYSSSSNPFEAAQSLQRVLNISEKPKSERVALCLLKEILCKISSKKDIVV